MLPLIHKGEKMETIGLFGTCGTSTWRQPFMERYAKEGIQFYNPQVEDWKPEDAVIEAEHLANDEIICFPITAETLAEGSLSEVGFSILNAIKLENSRDFVVFIDPLVSDELQASNPEGAKGSMRSRALVIQHLKKLRMANVYLVDSLDEMLEVSVVLAKAQQLKRDIQKYSLKA